MSYSHPQLYALLFPGTLLTNTTTTYTGRPR